MATNDRKDSSEFFELITDDGKSIFVIKKELTETDWADIERAGQDILKSVESISAPQMMLDLSQLDYMGSSMVALLLRIWKQVKAQEGNLVFVNREEGIYEILNLAGLTRIWTICDSREEAAKHLTTPLEKSGRKLKPLLATGAFIALILGVGSYLMLHRATVAVDIAILGKLQIAGCIVGMILSLWLLKLCEGKSRVVVFLMFLLASTVLSLGFLDVRIPGLVDPDAGNQVSTPQAELGKSDSTDQPPVNPFGDQTEDDKTANDEADTPLRADRPGNETTPDDSSSKTSPDSKLEKGTP